MTTKPTKQKQTALIHPYDQWAALLNQCAVWGCVYLLGGWVAAMLSAYVLLGLL